MTFVLDECLPPRLAKGMAAFGERVEHLTDRFPRGTRDVEWLPVLGAERCLLITEDRRIRRNVAEAALLREHAVGAFFLKGQVGYCKQVQLLVRRWPDIKQYARTHERPFRALVNDRGVRPYR